MLAHRTLGPLSPGFRAPEGQTAGTDDTRGPNITLSHTSQNLLPPNRRDEGAKVQCDTWMPGADHWGGEKAEHFIPGKGL